MRVAIVIAARNEERVLANTLFSILKLSSPRDVYLISDASTDNTYKIAKSFKIKVTYNRINIGKTLSLLKVIQKFSLAKRYDYIFFLDADTSPNANFYKYALRHFKKKKVAVVCGQVVSEMKMNLFVAYRSIMYNIWQNLYKGIFSMANGVTISPGTSSIYRSDIIDKIDFDKKIIIEDFDMTFQVHRKKLGKIVYEPKAIVSTQDPDNLGDYAKQITRWQLGFMQACIKHRVPFGFQIFDLGILLVVINDLLHSAFLVVIIPLTILAWINRLPESLQHIYGATPFLLLIMLVFDLWLILGLSLFHDLHKGKLETLYWGPLLWLVQYLSIYAFLNAGIKTLRQNVYSGWISPTRR